MGCGSSCSLSGPRCTASELLAAAAEGDIDTGMKALLMDGVSVHSNDTNGWTALHHAVRHDQVLFAKMLLQQGADPEAQNNNEATAMSLAQTDEMRAVLKRAGQRPPPSSLARILLMPGSGGEDAPAPALCGFAATVSQMHCRKPQPARGDDPAAQYIRVIGGEAAPAGAAAAGDAVATVAGDSEEDVGATLPAEDRLSSAALAGDAGAAAAALDAGALADTQDAHGWAPLHWAATGGHVPVAQLLLGRGASVRLANTAGWTALHCAARAGQLSMISFLVGAGADLAAVTSDGWTALHSAARAGQLPAAQLLIERGADAGAKTALGRTPLDMAKTAMSLAAKAATAAGAAAA